MASAMKGRRAGGPGRSGFRPDPRRQFLYVALTVAAILGGFGVASLLKEPAPPGPKETADATVPATPWYKSRPPPPSLITAPDAPIFPDTGADPLRAYEEGLPQEIFVSEEAPAPEEARPSPPPPVAVEPAPPATQKPAPSEPSSPEIAAAPDRPLPSWRRHAVADAGAGGRPVIALVIDDMGVDRKRSARVIGLKGPLTLSFLTYAGGLDRQTAAARAAGHELLLHIPMEPGSKHVDPGPNVLLSGMKPAELKRRLSWSLDRFGAYVGVNNHMGSKFTADAAAMAVVMEEIKSRGLMFLDSRTTSATQGGVLARRMGVPFLERNIFLDHDNDLAAIKARLAEVEKLARRIGFAIAIGHPREATIRALVPWLAGVEAKGFRLVPLTARLDEGREVAERL